MSELIREVAQGVSEIRMMVENGELEQYGLETFRDEPEVISDLLKELRECF